MQTAASILKERDFMRLSSSSVSAQSMVSHRSRSRHRRRIMGSFCRPFKRRLTLPDFFANFWTPTKGNKQRKFPGRAGGQPCETKYGQLFCLKSGQPALSMRTMPLSGYVPERYWSWSIHGIPATGHEVLPVGKHVCRLTLLVPFFAAPYVAVCRIAVNRIARIAEDQTRCKPA